MLNEEDDFRHGVQFLCIFNDSITRVIYSCFLILYNSRRLFRTLRRLQEFQVRFKPGHEPGDATKPPGWRGLLSKYTRKEQSEARLH